MEPYELTLYYYFIYNYYFSLSLSSKQGIVSRFLMISKLAMSRSLEIVMFAFIALSGLSRDISIIK